MAKVYRGKEIEVVGINGDYMDFKILNTSYGTLTIDLTNSDDCIKGSPSDVVYEDNEQGTFYMSEDWMDGQGVAYSGDDPKYPVNLPLAPPTDFASLRAKVRAAAAYHGDT